MSALMYRNVCTICHAVNVDSMERDICAACTPSSPPTQINFCKRCKQQFRTKNAKEIHCAGCDSLKEFVNLCTACGATTIDSVPRKICASCDSSAKKKLAATPKEKNSSATPSLKLFKIVVFKDVKAGPVGRKVIIRTSIVLEFDKETALTYESLSLLEQQEVTEIEGPFRAGFVIHQG